MQFNIQIVILHTSILVASGNLGPYNIRRYLLTSQNSEFILNAKFNCDSLKSSSSSATPIRCLF